MPNIVSTLRGANIQPEIFLKAAAILLGGGLTLSMISRIIFKKHSRFSHAVSSSIGLIFVYTVVIVAYSLLPSLRKFTPPLPFVHLTNDRLVLFSFESASLTTLCSQLMSMVALAFLANLLDEWIPDGPNAFTWFISKITNVAGGVIILILIHFLAEQYLQDSFLLYAPTVFLILLAVMMFVGALKIIIGIFLTTINPVIGAFYTFFFTTRTGKAISCAVLTTMILSALIYALAYIGCTAFSIVPDALIAYIPVAILLGLLWYGANQLL